MSSWYKAHLWIFVSKVRRRKNVQARLSWIWGKTMAVSLWSVIYPVCSLWSVIYPVCFPAVQIFSCNRKAHLDTKAHLNIKGHLNTEEHHNTKQHLNTEEHLNTKEHPARFTCPCWPPIKTLTPITSYFSRSCCLFSVLCCWPFSFLRFVVFFLLGYICWWLFCPELWSTSWLAVLLTCVWIWCKRLLNVHCWCVMLAWMCDAGVKDFWMCDAGIKDLYVWCWCKRLLNVRCWCVKKLLNVHCCCKRQSVQQRCKRLPSGWFTLR